MTKTDELIRRFRHLNVWRRHEQRAPHKPLLVLYALGKLQAGADRLLPFDEVEQPLTRLLQEFGPPRQSYHPELPFFHLQTDGVWQIDDEHALLTQRKGSRNPLRSELRNLCMGGGFPEPIFTDLKTRPEAVREIAREILAAHFPESLHQSIANAVALELDGSTRSNRRDAAFRSAVISAWAHSCAFCGFSVQLDNADLGLEAAHILWCQFGGPDAINNGLACCSIHHQAFDRGAITISDEHRILVSSRVHGGGSLSELFLALHGAPLGQPNRKEALPKRDFLAWHRGQVFRGEARD